MSTTTREPMTREHATRRSATAAPSPREPLAALQLRVDAFSRYADLVTAQLTALDEADLDTFALLADHRDALAAEIDAAPPLADLVAEQSGPDGEHAAGNGTAETDDADAAGATQAALLTRAHAELTRGAAAARIVDQSLQTMRLESQKAMQDHDSRGRALRQYLETDAAAQATVDISL